VEVMKRLRQQAIRDVLARRVVRTQEELVAALGERGIRVTQATVSRDMAEMGLTKTGAPGAQAYALPDGGTDSRAAAERRLRTILRDLPVEVRVSGTLLVIRAVPGSAHAIAAALDRSHWPDVVGSVAGDDTLFVAFADGEALERARERLLGLVSDPEAAPPADSDRPPEGPRV
jgi:transcriptional regulator of arginine metabolism